MNKFIYLFFRKNHFILFSLFAFSNTTSLFKYIINPWRRCIIWCLKLKIVKDKIQIYGTNYHIWKKFTIMTLSCFYVSWEGQVWHFLLHLKDKRKRTGNTAKVTSRSKSMVLPINGAKSSSKGTQRSTCLLYFWWGPY